MDETVENLRARVLYYYGGGRDGRAYQLTGKEASALLALRDGESLTWAVAALTRRLRASKAPGHTELVTLKERADGGLDVAPVRAPLKNQTQEVFEYWRQASGHPRAKLTAQRKKCVEARLRAGYDVERIHAAVDGMLGDSWLQERGHDDLTLCCRNDTTLEQYESKAQRRRPVQPASQGERGVKRPTFGGRR